MGDVSHQAVREHGITGPVVIVLHGGPGAPGSAAPIAHLLANSFRVLEPWQRGKDTSPAEPLTVATHISDLHDLIVARCPDIRPAIVGWSWGAMLALAYAAAHPEMVGPLVLVGCGTWDVASRAEIGATLQRRIDQDPDLRRRLDRLAEECPNPEQRQVGHHELTHHLYNYDPLPDEPDPDAPPIDMQAHTQTWEDMLRLQASGIYPAAFTAINSPVLMIHGDHDPHPGRMIRDSLQQYLPRLEYHELPRCGHNPWRERFARQEFASILSEWLLARM
jgi:pimeloyl-ACP methyl ester carboxylesterase